MVCPRKDISLQILLTRVGQHATQLLCSPSEWRISYQLWACLMSKSLLGAYLLSLFSDGICCTRHSYLGPRHLVFRRSLVLLLAYYRLFCHLEEGCISIWNAVITRLSKICWRRLTEWGGYPWLRPTEIGPCKIHWSFLMFTRDDRTVCCTVSLVKAHSTWIESVGRLHHHFCKWCFWREVRWW